MSKYLFHLFAAFGFHRSWHRNDYFFDFWFCIRFNCRQHWTAMGFGRLAHRRDESTVSKHHRPRCDRQFISFSLPSIFSFSFQFNFDCFFFFVRLWTFSIYSLLLRVHLCAANRFFVHFRQAKSVSHKPQKGRLCDILILHISNVFP